MKRPATPAKDIKFMELCFWDMESKRLFSLYCQALRASGPAKQRKLYAQYRHACKRWAAELG